MFKGGIMPSNRTFEEFYYLKDNKILPISSIEDEFHKNNNLNIGIFENNIFCPECYQAKLTFVQKGRRRCHLKKIKSSNHLEGCSYKYEYISNRGIKNYINHMSNEQVEDKLNSIMRYLFSTKKEIEERINNNLKPTENPILIEQRSQQNSYKYAAIRRKSLNSYIDLSMKDNIYIFYGKVKLKILEKTSRQENKYHLLEIYTLNKGEWTLKTNIYLGHTKDIIDEDKIYNIVFIANVSEYDGKWQLKLIRNNAIKYVLYN